MTPSFSVQSALAPSAPLKSATLPRLRDYQVKVKQQLYEEIRKGHQRILVVAATGAGKTVISAAIVYDMASIRGKRVLLVVHRDVLITQTQEKLANFGIEAGVIAGNYRENRTARVQVASVQTLSRRGLDWFQPDVVFWDEAHLSAFSGVAHQMMPRLREGKRCQWQDLLPDLQQLGLTLPVTFAQVKHAYKQLTGHGIDRPLEDKQAIDRAWENLKAQKPLIDGTYNPDDNTIHIGLTATPWRLSRREEMGDIFETLVCAPMPWQLMDMGYLVKPVYYSLPEADLQGVRTQAGDFAIKDLETRCNDEGVVEAAVREWQRLANQRGTIAFAVSVAHAQSIAKAFERVGVPAASVDGSMPTRERSAIYRKLALGEILVLSSCEALAEGFDVPSVSAIMLCRPTKSKSKYFQQVGRGLRIADRKTDCLVLDQAGLVRRFGFIEDLKWVNLEEAVEVETGEVPTKACPTHLGGCGGIVRAIAPTCPLCGYGFPQRQKLAPLQELVNFVPEEDKPKFFQYRQWLKEAYQQKLSPGWAASRYRESYRRQFPPLAWSRGAVFGEDPSARQRLEYWRHLRKVAAVKGKTDLWMKHCFHLEFGGDAMPPEG